VLAKIRTDSEWEINMATITAPYKTNGPGTPHFRTDAHAPATQYTVVVSERVANILYAATHGNILDGS
jgi:hypothetical protein